MSLPKKLLSKEYPLGDASFEARVVDVYSASANANTTYTHGDRILFSVPAFGRSFIDLSKTFMKFDADINCASGKCRFNEGLPVFERVVIRCSGVTIEDISGYYSLEKVMDLLHSKQEDFVGNMTGRYDYDNYGNTTDTTVADIQMNKTTYIKQLHTGVLGVKDYFFPVHRLNNSGLEIELTLSPTPVALKQVVAATTVTWALSNVKLQVHLIKVSDEFFKRYNAAASNSELVLPITTYRRHVSNIPSGQTDSVIYVNDNTKNLKRSYTIFRNNPGSIGNTEEPAFLKGSGDVGNELIRYQYRYMSRSFPEAPVEVTAGVDTLFLANTLVNSGHELMGDKPVLAKTYADNFLVCQDFKYSDDMMINGLNLNATGSPLILEVRFNGTGVACLVETFTETSAEVVINDIGNVSIVQKSLMTPQ